MYEIGGIQFVARAGQAEYLRGATVVTTQEIPAFVSHITLRAVINVNYKEVWIYSLKKEDIRALGEKLSVGRRLTAVGYARIYAVWLDGKLVVSVKLMGSKSFPKSSIGALYQYLRLFSMPSYKLRGVKIQTSWSNF